MPLAESECFQYDLSATVRQTGNPTSNSNVIRIESKLCLELLVVQKLSYFRKQHMPGYSLSVKGMFTRADSQLIFLLEFLQTHRTNLERENNKFQ